MGTRILLGTSTVIFPPERGSFMCFKSVFNRLRKHDQSSHTMRASRLLPLLMAVILISCQARPAVTKPTNISVLTEPTATQRSPIRALPTSTLIPTQSATSGHPAETPLSQPIDFSIQEGQPFADVPLKAFQPVPYRGKLDTLPIQFDQFDNVTLSIWATFGMTKARFS